MTAAAKVSPQTIQRLQATRKAAGISDEDWRARLRRDAGVASTTELTEAVAGRMLAALPPKGGGAAPRRVGGPYGPLAQALWIAAWQLGLVEDRSDTALLAFVRRQTGLDALNWARRPEDGRAVVEALKAMLLRDAGVDWQRNGRRGVLWALGLRLAAAGLLVPAHPNGVLAWRDIGAWGARAVRGLSTDPTAWTAKDCDKAAMAAGRALRSATAEVEG